MPEINVKRNPEVDIKFDNYPIHIKTKLLQLRKLILDTADNSNSIKEIEETLKWGEPS